MVDRATAREANRQEHKEKEVGKTEGHGGKHRDKEGRKSEVRTGMIGREVGKILRNREDCEDKDIREKRNKKWERQRWRKGEKKNIKKWSR